MVRDQRKGSNWGIKETVPEETLHIRRVFDKGRRGSEPSEQKEEQGPRPEE